MSELLNTLSYPTLFLVCLLSSTLLPLASELFVLSFLNFDFNPFLVLFTSTLANSLGSITTYLLAFLGKKEILERYFKNSLKKISKVDKNFNHFGAFYAFFSFLPLFGDIFVLGLGFAKYSLLKTCIFIGLGKFVRYFCLFLLYFYEIIKF